MCIGHLIRVTLYLYHSHDILNSWISLGCNLFFQTTNLLFRAPIHVEIFEAYFNNFVGSKRSKKQWTQEEIEAVKRLHHILIFRLPGKEDIMKVMREYPVLHRRTWRNIKDYCRNNRAKLMKP